MTIQSILSADSPRLQDTDSIAVAARMLLDRRLAAVPVVDATGRYQGIFSMDRLFSLLLPKAVLIEGGVTDLSFMSDPMEMLCERMRGYRSETVGNFVDTDARVLHPDTPLLETVLLLYRGENDIPVVDAASGQLLGMVEGAELLQRVCGRDEV